MRTLASAPCRRSSTAAVHFRRSPSARRRARCSHAAPSRTAVTVTTWYAGPLPWAWWQYQSRRASSPSPSRGIQPSRQAASNSSSRLPTTWWVSWTNSTRRPYCGGRVSAFCGGIRSNEGASGGRGDRRAGYGRPACRLWGLGGARGSGPAVAEVAAVDADHHHDEAPTDDGRNHDAAHHRQSRDHRRVPTARGAAIPHTYSQPGTYTATLQVCQSLSDSGVGSGSAKQYETCDSASVTIDVLGPNVLLTPPFSTGVAPLTVSFTGQDLNAPPECTIGSWTLDFGDGSSASGSGPPVAATHT